MPSTPPPPFTALLLGLTGCLVDFGARTLPLALQRTVARHTDGQLDEVAHLAPTDQLEALLKRRPRPAERARLQDALVEAAHERAEPAPGLDALLGRLASQNIPAAWLEELPEHVTTVLAQSLPESLPPAQACTGRPWPTPDSCWNALAGLGVERLEGCVLVSGEPRLLQAGLNAGLWTVGLAASGRLCGHALGDWHALPANERDARRARATLELYRLGAHSVIDHLGELPDCLDDLASRRQKGEKP